jgi:hypothetical protein
MVWTFPTVAATEFAASASGISGVRSHEIVNSATEIAQHIIAVLIRIFCSCN